MQVGDLVKWIGYPGATLHPSKTGPKEVGMIVKIWVSEYNDHDKRVDVMWGGGRLGKGLYPQTIEVICEVVIKSLRNSKQR